MPQHASTARIHEFIRSQVSQHPTDIATVAAQQFGISRQAAHRHLSNLVAEGVLLSEGKTSGRRYSLAETVVEKTYAVTPGLEEHVVWDQFAEPFLAGLPGNVQDICHYGFTEMVNNVVDHSESSSLYLKLLRSPEALQLEILDGGVGIFRKIQREANLESRREAIFELTKGKFTTDPARHTGEGIFFTSRVFDRFSIISGELSLYHGRATRDWLIEDAELSVGTGVFLKISATSQHTLKEVFDLYQLGEQDDYAFAKTTVLLTLASSGNERLVSRSQARRVLARLEQFKEVFFDFKGVQTVGPAFIDEIFRVFRLSHPDVSLVPTEANEEVLRLIARATHS